MEYLDSIIDILFVIGAIALGFLPGIKKMLGEVKEPKKVVRPVHQEYENEPEEEVVQPKRNKKKAANSAPTQPTENEEYFSYETMSDRDFENLFAQSEEEAVERMAAETPHKELHLTLDEEEVYKGVVWSEILHRKYE
jgi:hypothetical protein